MISYIIHMSKTWIIRPMIYISANVVFFRFWGLLYLLFCKLLNVHLILQTQVVQLPDLLILVFKFVYFLDKFELVDWILLSHFTVLNIKAILSHINLILVPLLLNLVLLGLLNLSQSRKYVLLFRGWSFPRK